MVFFQNKDMSTSIQYYHSQTLMNSVNSIHNDFKLQKIKKLNLENH